MQLLNIENGINKVGIPDLIIARNTLQHDAVLFSFDKHFILMESIHHLKLYSELSY